MIKFTDMFKKDLNESIVSSYCEYDDNNVYINGIRVFNKRDDLWYSDSEIHAWYIGWGSKKDSLNVTKIYKNNTKKTSPFEDMTAHNIKEVIEKIASAQKVWNSSVEEVNDKYNSSIPEVKIIFKKTKNPKGKTMNTLRDAGWS